MTEEDKRIKEFGLSYLQDQILYMLWKYLNGCRFVKKNILTFWDIVPEGLGIGLATKTFLITLEITDIPLERSAFYIGDYREAQKEQIPVISSAILMGATGIKDILKRPKNPEAETYTNFGVEQYDRNTTLYGSSSMLNFFEFSNQLSKYTTIKLDKFISAYIDRFINDELKKTNKNFYRFDKQKQILFDYLRKMEEKFGNQFIIEATSHATIEGKYYLAGEENNKEYLFVHTLITLERQGYFTVEDIWVANSNSWEKERNLNDYYSVKLVLGDRFYREVYPKKQLFIDKESFDEKRGILKFAGQEIELAKKDKETDAVLLLKTLLGAEINEWKHNDEILYNWGYNDDDLKDSPKNKIYFAIKKINNAVALKTNIEDLVEGNTSKARINPKYRKKADE